MDGLREFNVEVEYHSAARPHRYRIVARSAEDAAAIVLRMFGEKCVDAVVIDSGREVAP